MNTVEPAIPKLTCNQIDVRFHMDWEVLDGAFSDLESIDLGQAWNDRPQESLRPTTVRTARTDESLLVC